METMGFEEMWEKIIACDKTYDGLFYTAVKTTKIYCRPSCRSRKPKKENVRFYAHREEAQTAGFRACKRCRPEAERTPHAALIRSVSAFLLREHKQALSLRDISAFAGVSPYHLERLFKQETSETPRSFLEKIRVDKAARLLRTTDRGSLDICYESGFRSPSHFYKAFRRLTACTPSQYRRRSADSGDAAACGTDPAHPPKEVVVRE
ncbi:bifunctional transcriptional activator/DNA repair enzyme AdaA [Paenibacillus sp. P22]|uniref:bifunctional transcriptional activator/DNA repair enzyme AdaA n=1 Tax=Paenibacillus sp. P22 TaxID=483908 RepID=UPI000410403C|nr:Ada metal-binding domain-containing protein [Paenibacillus sp. P22]CDN41421.1 Bifunctional transcriptional activator/DNA repair enzyme AdaA [Paenibacillus sp. P22]